MDKVIVKREDNGIVWVTINREQRRNAVDYDVIDQLGAILKELKENLHDKVLVITGSGDKAFCSGGDLVEFKSLYTRKDAYNMLSKMGEVLYELATFPKPSIALLNGMAVGGGCELATACDFRLASSASKFGFVQGRLAITTGWGGASILMERLGSTQSLEMLIRAKMYTAEEGLQMGYIQKVLEKENLQEECRAWISEILEQSTEVLSAYKLCAIERWENNNLRSRMFQEIRECSKLWEQEEHHEAVRKFLK